VPEVVVAVILIIGTVKVIYEVIFQETKGKFHDDVKPKKG
jgi:hypothetical protein